MDELVLKLVKRVGGRPSSRFAGSFSAFLVNDVRDKKVSLQKNNSHDPPENAPNSKISEP